MNIDTSLVNNDYAAVLLAFFIVIYAFTLSRMTLPDYVKNLFDNTIFKILFLSLLLIYGFKKSPHVAIIVALVFVITMEKLDSQEMFENVAYLETYMNDQKNKTN